MEENEAGEVVRHALLTDIQGSEDHWGDMDFKARPRTRNVRDTTDTSKVTGPDRCELCAFSQPLLPAQVAGTRDGITALQLDVKRDGVPLEVRSDSPSRALLSSPFLSPRIVHAANSCAL